MNEELIKLIGLAVMLLGGPYVGINICSFIMKYAWGKIILSFCFMVLFVFFSIMIGKSDNMIESWKVQGIIFMSAIFVAGVGVRGTYELEKRRGKKS